MAKNKEATKKQLRNFGIALTVFLIVIGFIHFKKGNVTQYQWIWGIALGNLIISLSIPVVIKPIYKAAMFVAHIFFG